MRKFGLIGRSLHHSWSKKYFDHKFQEEKISNCSYENYPMASLDEIESLIAGDQYLDGLNVTNPYKIEILRWLDQIDPEAEGVGAVNCIKITRDGSGTKLTGYNTDKPAFRKTLAGLTGEHEKKALVLGTGGASRAVCSALDELLIPFQVVSRRAEGGIITYRDIMQETIENHLVIINATPVGLWPETDQAPELPYQYLTSNHILYDLVYNPRVTQFLKRGIEAGASIFNGLEMLQEQAEISWQIWNRSVPGSVRQLADRVPG